MKEQYYSLSSLHSTGILRTNTKDFISESRERYHNNLRYISFIDEFESGVAEMIRSLNSGFSRISYDYASHNWVTMLGGFDFVSSVIQVYHKFLRNKPRSRHQAKH